MVSLFSLGYLLKEEKIKIQILNFLIYFSGIYIFTKTQGRSQLLAFMIGSFLLLGYNFVKKINKRKSILMILIILIGVAGSYKLIPQQNKSRFLTSLNTEKTVENVSNALRIEMWKIAIQRIKKNKWLGSSTQYKNQDFQYFVEKMPEKDNTDLILKSTLKYGGFNDAHNIYLNIIVENGIFSLAIFILWLIPIYTFFKKNKKKLLMASYGAMLGFLIIGLFWNIWEDKSTSLLFYIIISITITEFFRGKNDKLI
ncbi:MAG: O-antigen ligase family protein, partial [Cetobacterium sp.]